ncbi:alpha/beta hydrolase-fold protein [Sporosarcina sp.]|uniref:alpha/beta hydrolase n=1 Tax=Sporosarcina sp. TaxID=49982 RepID=UPI00262CC08C|nr:alpha/beta hydrolase-fold protein [Sporosarcina sp.]
MLRDIVERFPHPTAGSSYSVTVSIPNEEPPAEGFPVLYILDGNAYGLMCKELLKLQWQRTEKTHIAPMIIVSIGYATEELHPSLRVFDFTPTPSAASLPERPDGTEWPAYGGAKEFLQFLEATVQPLVRRHASVDQENQILFGHSLGGLFVLYALFERPDMFSDYLSCSPSIWWNDQEILTYEQKDCLDSTKRLFLAAEQQEKGKMYESAFALYTRLKEHHPDSVTFTSPAGENHMSIVPTIFSEAIRFFYRGTEEAN